MLKDRHTKINNNRGTDGVQGKGQMLRILVPPKRLICNMVVNLKIVKK